MNNHIPQTVEARSFWPLLVLTFILFCLPCPTNAADKPLRVVSMNLCTDQFLLELADRKQILSLSPYAVDQISSYHWDKAQGLPRIPEGSESVLKLKPDVLLATSFDRPNTLNHVRNQGIKVIVLKYPSSLEQIADQYRIVGKAIGQEHRGEQHYQKFLSLIKSSKNTLSSLQISALYYQSSGYASGHQSLVGLLFKHIGLKNHATKHGIAGYGNISLEEIIASPPDIFMIARYNRGSEDQGHKMLRHPALLKIISKKTVMDFPVSETVCPGPGTIGALNRLIELRQNY